MVTIGASMFFAEISGSAVADVAALGTILNPGDEATAAIRRNSPRRPSSSAASLAIIIPPSIPMILYAVMAQTSMVKMFVAGIVPGLLGAVALAGRRLYPRRRYDFPIEEKFRLANVWRTRKEALWAFILPIIILGGIFGGIVTATEGAGLAVLASIVHRRSDLPRSRFARTAKSLHRRRRADRGGHAAGGEFGADRHVPHRGATAAGARRTPSPAYHEPIRRAALLNVVFLILGMFLHSAAAIILTDPDRHADDRRQCTSIRSTSGWC